MLYVYFFLVVFSFTVKRIRGSRDGEKVQNEDEDVELKGNQEA